MRMTLKMKMTSKMKTTFKTKIPQKNNSPPHLRKYYLKFFDDLLPPEMLSGVQTWNWTPHDKYNICGIAHARTNRKDDIFMQRRLVQNFTYILEWGQGTCSLMKHIRRCWAYSRYFFPACCLLRFAAFFRRKKHLKLENDLYAQKQVKSE